MKPGALFFSLTALVFLFVSTGLTLAQEENETALKIVNNITALYLSDDIEGAQTQAAKLKTFLLTQTQADPGMETLADFMSGKSVPLDLVNTGFAERPDAWAVANVAIFTRNVALGRELEEKILLNNLGNYTTALPHLQSENALKWEKHVAEWTKWCKNSFKKSAKLEPLLAKRSSNGNEDEAGEESKEETNDSSPDSESDIMSLTATTLDKLHKEKYKKRYRPADFDFSADNTNMIKYLSNISNTRIRTLEEARLRYLAGVKQNIVATFERNPYTGKIKLNKGTTNGTIALANENSLIIRKKNAKKGTPVKWNDISPEQVARFLEYYGDMRMKVTGGIVSEQEKKTEAAKQYLAAAVLADWYGEYDLAVKLMKKTFKANPGVKEKSSVFFLE